MRIPMHRFKYTKLTSAQIGTKLKATDGGPRCASPFSNALNGKTVKIVTQDGPVLEYKFAANRRLTLTENGAKPLSAGYGELTLNQIVFFAHMIPGQQKGYNVFIDQKTNLATVFEVWLSSGIKQNVGRPTEFTLDDREVQRQIYFGYVDTGQVAPKDLHHYTNRMTGKGLHWKQDNGIETLELYVSVANTNFVELTRLIDDLSYVAPSDYVLVDDRTIVYNRTECEFSGIHTCFVADLYGVKQVGVRLGFNEKDELEYYMFRGDGKVVGQIAYLENFDEHGRVPMFAAAPPRAAGAAPTTPAPQAQKGARTTYRPVRTFTHMTDEEVQAAALVRTSAFGSGGGAAGPQGAPPAGAAAPPPQGLGTGNNLPFSDILVGKEFTLRFDNGGPVRDYKVDDKFKLQYRDHSDNAWHEADYRAYEGDDNLAWFSHMLADSKPRASVQVAVDFSNGLATSIESHMGTQYYGNETTYRPVFGVAEMAGLEAPIYVRHQLTDELVGNCFSWSYSDTTTSMHVYSSPHSMSWVIFTGAQVMGAEWCSPCIYVKLRDGVYIFCQNEEACNGNQMTELLNTKASHDCGFTFNGGARGVNLGVTGAIGRHIGKFDLLSYYGPKKEERLMSINSRRSFIWKMGAGASTALVPMAVMAKSEPRNAEDPSLRVAMLEEEKVLRRFHHNFEQAMDQGRHDEVIGMFAEDARVMINGGVFSQRSQGVSRLYRDVFPSGKAGGRMESAPGFELGADQQHDSVRVAADRRSAEAIFPYSIQMGAPFETESSLAAMARLHGEGVRTWWEGGLYRISYRKDSAQGRWKIVTLEYDTLSRADYRAGRSYARPISSARFATRFPQDQRGPDELV